VQSSQQEEAPDSEGWRSAGAGVAFALCSARWGERALGAVLPFCCLVLREGKREFEDLVPDEDPQVELLRVFVALEPHDAGGFFFRADGRCLEHAGLHLLGRVR
jgi:hypothetical protein